MTATDGGTLTFAAAAVVTGGTSTDSLYQTDSDALADTGAGTLITTETTTLASSNAGESAQTGTTTTSTLVNNSLDTSGGPTTQTETQGLVLGSNAVVASGADRHALVQRLGGSSLYQVNNAITAAGSSLNQPAGTAWLDETAGLSGSEAATMTVTATATFSSTQASTLILGSNATIASGLPRLVLRDRQ